MVGPVWRGVAEKLAVVFTQLQRAERTKQTVVAIPRGYEKERGGRVSFGNEKTERRIGGDVRHPGGTRTSETISLDKRRDQKAEVNTRCAIVSRTCRSVGWDREEREKSG